MFLLLRAKKSLTALVICIVVVLTLVFVDRLLGGLTQKVHVGSKPIKLSDSKVACGEILLASYHSKFTYRGFSDVGRLYVRFGIFRWRPKVHLLFAEMPAKRDLMHEQHCLAQTVLRTSFQH